MPSDGTALRCQRCGEVPEDLWRCRVNLKVQLLCPGCLATRRMRGDDCHVMGAAE